MSKISPALLLTLLLSVNASAEVWRCHTADGPKFSDKPCPTAGRPIEARRLQPNVVEAIRVPSAVSDPLSPPITGQAGNVCPGDAELRNWDTRASSSSLSAAEKAFFADELRRARQCRKGQGRYAEEDWRVSRDAQAAQANISGRADARRAAEGMHSAADPLEGERIARQRVQEESDRRLEALRQRRAAGCMPGAPCPIVDAKN